MTFGEIGPIITIVILLASGVATSSVALFRLKSVEEQLETLSGRYEESRVHERALNLQLTDTLGRVADATASIVEYQERADALMAANASRSRATRDRVDALERVLAKLQLEHISRESGVPVEQLQGVSGVIGRTTPEQSRGVPVR